MAYERDVLIHKEQIVKKNCNTQQGTYVPLSCLLDEMISKLNSDVVGNLTGNVTGAVLGGGTAGTAAAGVTETVIELGNRRIVTLTLTGVNTGTIAGAGNESQGALIYTLPAGNIQFNTGSFANVALSNTDGNVDADTPQLGIGTTQAVAASATLSVATENNLIYVDNSGAASTAADVNGTDNQVYIDAATMPLFIALAGAHTLYFNVADAWAGGETTGVVVDGTVVLDFYIL